VCINLQFKAQILSIDRNDENSNDVEAANEGDVERDDEEQTAAEPEPSVSNFWLIQPAYSTYALQ